MFQQDCEAKNRSGSKREDTQHNKLLALPISDRGKVQKKVKGVMFVPCTPYIELAKRLRQTEESLEELTGSRLKIVERAESKLTDILVSINPWSGQDCQRIDCMLCKTKTITGKNLKIRVVYKIWCGDCQKEMETKIDDLEVDDEQKSKMKLKQG